MSTSVQAQQDFAKMVMSHSAMEAVRTRIQLRLFTRFRTASPEERELINAIMDNEKLFFQELKILVNETKQID